MKSKIKYIILIIIGLLVISQSVYIKNLDDVKNTAEPDAFDPQAYVLDFWENRLPIVLDQAVDVNVLLPLLRQNMNKAVSAYAKTLGVSSKHAYLITGSGTIVRIDQSGFFMDTNGNGKADVLLIALDLFGNAVRDASGLVDVSDFPNSMEFNAISSGINKLVRERVVNSAKSTLQPGQSVTFSGAAKVSQEDPQLDPLGIIPVAISAGKNE